MLRFLANIIIQPAHAAPLGDIYTPSANLPQPNEAGILSTFLNPIVALVPVLTGLLSFTVSLLAGFKYISSSGDAKKTQEASVMLTYSLVGLGLSALAFTLTRLLFTVGGAEGLF